MAITEHEAAAGRAARTRPVGRRSCSSTACGCCRAAGIAGRAVFEEAGYTTARPGWPDDPETVAEANAHPEVFADKSIRPGRRPLRGGRSATLDTKPAVIGHSFGGLLAQILAGRGLAAASVAIDPAPFRGVLPLPISALQVRPRRCWRTRRNRSRAVPLTYEQFRYAFANAVSEEEAKELYETYAVPGAGRAAVPGGDRQPQPLDRGQGRHQEPGPRAAADHLGREGQHRPVGDRQRLVQAAEAQRGRDRDRQDRRPRPRARRSTAAGARSPTPLSRSSQRFVEPRPAGKKGTVGAGAG